jgi:serine/threonine-protein kinase RsbW
MEASGMIKLVIESALGNIALIGGAVRGIVDALDLDKTNCYHLELCVVEAVTNVIKHAYHYAAGHYVEVDIMLDHERITFKIHDTGQSMRAEKIKSLDFDPQDLQAVPERGMGRFIMGSLMDEIRYETVEGQNILTMTKRFSTCRKHQS